MMEFMLKAKLHRASITQADLHYEGSISIDFTLMQAAGIREFEKVHIYNINNGERFETYAIKAEEGSGVIGLNGAAARKGVVGDKIIIVTYCLVNNNEQDEFRPKIVLLGAGNAIERIV